MHFGEPLPDERFLALIRLAYEKGIRTFLTADVYGMGEADILLGRALDGIPRDTYCLVGAIGHDFYHGQRDGSKGFPRFTDAALRKPGEYASYLRSATEKSLGRCRADRFDLLLLHNPDVTGYTSDKVWNGMEKLKDAGLTSQLGLAPGPANGFTLDLILSLERFQGLVDWAMARAALPSGCEKDWDQNCDPSGRLRRPLSRRCKTRPSIRAARSPQLSPGRLGRGWRRENRQNARHRRSAWSDNVTARLHLESATSPGAMRRSNIDPGTRRDSQADRDKGRRTSLASGANSNSR
jgi:hypothetical protein